MTRRTSFGAVFAAVAIALTLVGTFILGGASSVHAAKPEITFQFPRDGAVLKERAIVLQLCFKNPINVHDLPPLADGDFHFEVRPPGNVGGLGLRQVFQPDGYGIAIYPGPPASEPPEGEWTWKYRVVDGQTKEPLEGVVKFTINATNGEDILQQPPAACLAEGATQQPTAPVVGTTAPTSTTAAAKTDNGSDTDALTIGLIVAGILAAGAVSAVTAFLIRRRIGSHPGTPPEGGNGPSDGPP